MYTLLDHNIDSGAAYIQKVDTAKPLRRGYNGKTPFHQPTNSDW